MVKAKVLPWDDEHNSIIVFILTLSESTRFKGGCGSFSGDVYHRKLRDRKPWEGERMGTSRQQL